MRQRREMLATALDLFSQKGYHNVSMQEIAEKAEFAIGTLYKFFQSKEDLYRTMVLERCDDFKEACLRAMAQSDDEVEQLRHLRALPERAVPQQPALRAPVSGRNPGDQL